MRSMLAYLLLVPLALLAGCSDPGERQPADNLPWQIEVHPDGSSTVMGIHLTRDTLLDVKRTLDERANIALFLEPDGERRIEAYYGRVNLSGLTGRLVSIVDASEAQLDTIEKLSHNPRPQPSGAIKRELEDKAFEILEGYRVGALTFVPVADFTEALIRKYFGEPAEIIDAPEKRAHWLYPEKGLAILVDPEDDELLQYVPPRDFGLLRTTIVEGRDEAGEG